MQHPEIEIVGLQSSEITLESELGNNTAVKHEKSVLLSSTRISLELCFENTVQLLAAAKQRVLTSPYRHEWDLLYFLSKAVTLSVLGSS